MSTKAFSWLSFSILVSGLATGCDLIEFAKNPSITLTLPTRMFKFDTSDGRWKSPPPAFNQSVPCNAPADCCRNPPGAPAGTSFDCAAYPLVCDSNICGISIDYEVPQPIDLKKDAPEFAEVGGRVVKEVLLKEISYIANNQIGVELPPIEVFVGPAGATKSTDDQVKLLVTLPKTPANMKTEQTVTLTPEAQKAFSDRALNLESPFTMLAGTDVIVRSGTPPPQGSVDVTVTGKITVKF
jgi:hypothetical protein